MRSFFENRMNRSSQQVINSNLTMYADDHQMYKTGSNLAMVKLEGLEEQGKHTMSWYEENYLQANAGKFRTLTIDPRNVNTSQQNKDIFMNGQIVKNKDQIELLGEDIDNSLHFRNHIRELCKKASREVGILIITRLRNLLPCSAKLIIYKTSILPYLTYCVMVWHFCKNGLAPKRLEEIFNLKQSTYAL